MTILVTGATGTVGRHVVEQLVQRGQPVRAISRNPKRANLPESVEVISADLNNSGTLKQALQDVMSMFLIVSSDQANANLQTDPKIVKMAEEAGVQKITVLVGFEEGPVEDALKNSKMKWTLLKPTEFMSNVLEDWKESIRSEGMIQEPFGDAQSARVHEADIASVAVTALLEDGHEGKSYPLLA